MVKADREKEGLFFVEVRDPNNVKRNIFESLRDIVQSLQKFERFKQLRNQKVDSISKLRKDLKDVNKLVSDLKIKLPEARLREAKLKPVLREVPKRKEPTKKQYKREAVEREDKPTNELQKLESELSAIEEKLKGLQ